ncbi:UDP-N-acetylmuramate dehydrogenase [Suipraeoptans intestinalis]|uniref:UDP-N-acetylmuramate dehydrogenase n=1 Tax=Suipraeoptans intestinalis TaxID=2606628 RepID=UPI0023F4CB7C|nr:UDP-N-acetylmuramate dehydrogenase [Suipraeoptans intestinalis]MDD7770273.1 UDP-N-acetylmuramate dehydrogenase [Suipraeoptans intestinalis]
MDQTFLSRLKEELREDQIRQREPMKGYVTFRVGGEADYFLLPETEEEVGEILSLCREFEIPYYIVGNGSNLLVSDQGYRGAVVYLRKLQQIRVEGNRIHAQAGALLSKVAVAAWESSLAGFEFAEGIPGTIGGACVMNAGAYGGELKDVLESAVVLTPEGEIRRLSREEMELGYRISVVSKKGYVALGVTLKLQEGNQEEIGERMADFKQRRVTKQPLEYPSAGSTFKRPEGYFAGKLIQDTGLRGFSCGGAQVSEKHCGFVINRKDATAAEVYSLICQVSDRVYEKFGVRLEPEVKRLGEF